MRGPGGQNKSSRLVGLGSAIVTTCRTRFRPFNVAWIRAEENAVRANSIEGAKWSPSRPCVFFSFLAALVVDSWSRIEQLSYIFVCLSHPLIRRKIGSPRSQNRFWLNSEISFLQNNLPNYVFHIFLERSRRYVYVEVGCLFFGGFLLG